MRVAGCASYIVPTRHLLSDPAFMAMVKQDLDSGVHRNETGRLDYFTTAYLHRPEELEEEVREAGFEDVRVLGLEGPGWILPDFDDRWRDPARREELLWLARTLEEEPSIRAASAHLLAVARKPEGREGRGVEGRGEAETRGRGEGPF